MSEGRVVDARLAVTRIVAGTHHGCERFGATWKLVDAVDFARTTRQSVLTTIRSNGRPQLSNVLHHVFGECPTSQQRRCN